MNATIVEDQSASMRRISKQELEKLMNRIDEINVTDEDSIHEGKKELIEMMNNHMEENVMTGDKELDDQNLRLGRLIEIKETIKRVPIKDPYLAKRWLKEARLGLRDEFMHYSNLDAQFKIDVESAEIDDKKVIPNVEDDDLYDEDNV